MVCNKLGAGMQYCNSIPKNLNTEKQIEAFISALMKNCASWRALKLVTLGNGCIGKTTLLRKLTSILDPNYIPKEVCSKNLVPSEKIIMFLFSF
jgi:hypothetical protein